MFRHALNDLKSWSEREEPKPLLLRGARQVGKSTLVRLFCARHGFDLLEINLEKTKLRELENETSFSVKKLIAEIELVQQKKVSGDTLLFLDEIQAQPIALNRLRYFHEDAPALKVIAAGSLLEAAIEQEKFPIPVGRVEYYQLGPMTFSEFLEAKNETVLLSQIQALALDSPPSEALHERATELLREYYFVGGMPEAVKEFVSSRDMKKARDVHHSLIQTYRDDIPKYTRHKQGQRVREVFEYAAAHLGQAKISFRGISETNSAVVKEAIDLLHKARVIIKVLHNQCSGLPLKAGESDQAMKLFFLDVGLYNAMTGLQWSDLFKFEADELLTKGHMAEQFVAQHLMYRDARGVNAELYYWLRGGKKGAAEVDFVIAVKSRILPIEVKSGSTGKMRSLWQYVAAKKPRHVLRFDLKRRERLLTEISHEVVTSAGVAKIRCRLLGLPLYCVEFLERFVVIPR